MVVSNSAQFQQLLNAQLAVALENTMEQLLIRLGEIIEEEVYSYQSDGEWDNRTGEFKKSWSASIPTMVSGWMQSTISNDTFAFTWDSDNWSHGNMWQSLTAIEMDNVINNRSGGSNFGFPALVRPFWSQFIMEANQTIHLIFAQECKKIGLNINFDIGTSY